MDGGHCGFELAPLLDVGCFELKRFVVWGDDVHDAVLFGLDDATGRGAVRQQEGNRSIARGNLGAGVRSDSSR